MMLESELQRLDQELRAMESESYGLGSEHVAKCQAIEEQFRLAEEQAKIAHLRQMNSIEEALNQAREAAKTNYQSALGAARATQDKELEGISERLTECLARLSAIDVATMADEVEAKSDLANATRSARLSYNSRLAVTLGERKRHEAESMKRGQQRLSLLSREKNREFGPIGAEVVTVYDSLVGLARAEERDLRAKLSTIQQAESEQLVKARKERREEMEAEISQASKECEDIKKAADLVRGLGQRLCLVNPARRIRFRAVPRIKGDFVSARRALSQQYVDAQAISDRMVQVYEANRWRFKDGLLVMILVIVGAVICGLVYLLVRSTFSM